MNQPINAIRDFVVENFYVPDGRALADDASLTDLGIVDSTGVLEISAFGVVVDDDEILPENFDTLARIAAFVSRKRIEAA